MMRSPQTTYRSMHDLFFVRDYHGLYSFVLHLLRFVVRGLQLVLAELDFVVSNEYFCCVKKELSVVHRN